MGQTYQSIVIQAPAEVVWAAIRDFHDMSWAPNVITSLTRIGDAKGDEVGARKKLNDAFEETLIEFSEPDRHFAYTIDDGPAPVSKNDVLNYVGRVSVREVTEGNAAFVQWSSVWSNKNDAAADFCHGIYVALLHDMKKSLEG